MTERGSHALTRGANWLTIGPSDLHWDGGALNIRIDEMCMPFARRLRGRVRVEPTGINEKIFSLDRGARHLWRPIAPSAHVSVDFDAPNLGWSGDGYLDTNAGSEALEEAFDSWTWSRAKLPQGTAILYDTKACDGGTLSLALRFDASGQCEECESPPRTALPKTGWRVERETRSDDGTAHVERTFEDTPFYSRSLISNRLFNESVHSMHESLSLTRFRNPIVKLMLPFRMPRR
jgi:carotenoid 1,2-hydratase